MFTRKIYDKGAYAQSLYEWKRPGNYLLMPESNHRGDDTCFMTRPELRPAGTMLKISDCNDMADIESDLRNIPRKASKDPLQQYPFVKFKYKKPPKIRVCKKKKENFDITYGKLDGNQWNRGKSIMVPRFESLCLNPQKLNRIRSNSVIGTNTRLFNRDTHIPDIPVVYDQTNKWLKGACINNEKNSCMGGQYTTERDKRAFASARGRDYFFAKKKKYDYFDPVLDYSSKTDLRRGITPAGQYINSKCKKCIK